ncbi:protein CELLULOSE SYNTHASE INTERACTIVE 1-like [Andrographis paniculata]|uniref:protein CELLULOSE SYNTHASE INTERACTIVE 1-like n=1 Tax=Andrographis paniculata TaxID=175694 RepID=UPI0021E8EF9E|nr:protein CELLULOSE SYNTHASE INTERACTIVE 1-like [Andrographis paniculata]
MNPATVPPPLSPAEAPQHSASGNLESITEIINRLLPSTLSITCFASRWQVLRGKLISLKSVLNEIVDSPHWTENPLLPQLLPSLLATVQRTETLSQYCSGGSVSRGKLLMQSDLDMAAGWLSRQMNDLELLLRSGVLHQSTAIVLSRPNPSSSKEELTFFVKDLFTRLQIGGQDFKRKALDSLIELLTEDDKSAAVVAKEGNVSFLVSLLDLNSNDSIRELAVHVVSLLVSAGDVPRKCVFEEGALGPLLKMIDCSSMPMKEKAAMAVEYITSDPDNAWAISAYGGVPILMELCKSGSMPSQSHAVGAIRNVSTVEDIRISLAEEGIVPVLMQLLDSGNSSAQAKAANCISILASTGEHFRSLLLQEKALPKLLQLFHECSTADTLESVLGAISSVSASDASYRYLSRSNLFVLRISELVKHGNLVRLQHMAASLLAKLPISDGTKMGIAGCMSCLMKLMETVKPDGIQEVGAKALISLLSVKANRKELVRDEKSVMRLVQMLDPKNDAVSKKFPVAVVAAIMGGGSQSCRKKLVEAGAYGHLQRLVDMDVAGAKKALQRLSGNRLTSIFSRSWRDY